MKLILKTNTMIIFPIYIATLKEQTSPLVRNDGEVKRHDTEHVIISKSIDSVQANSNKEREKSLKSTGTKYSFSIKELEV